MSSSEPYCFVLMPFGRRPDRAGGAEIDFDRIYREGLAPAIEAAGLYPYRDDTSAVGGIVQKQMYEALLLCDFAIADLTIENSNVYYELGIRHAVRPSSTLAISANVDSIPFDVANLRTVRYQLNKHNILDEALAAELREAVTSQLNELRQHVSGRTDYSDSPLFQLVEGWRPVRPESLKTDLFAERVVYHEGIKRRLAQARVTGLRVGRPRIAALADLAALRSEIGVVDKLEAGVLVDLLLTYRAFEEWDQMCDLVELMPGFLRERTLVQEQLAFALNRRAEMGEETDRDRALQVLRSLVDDGRSSSETWGLIGRIHKDRWRAAHNPHQTRRHLRAAIDAYQRGFRQDPTDPYPGINAVSLLRISGTAQDLQAFEELSPVVVYAVQRLLEVEQPTYWMYASLVELAILRHDESAALDHLDKALAAVREHWEPKTTMRNISDLAAAGVVTPGGWVDLVIAQLADAAAAEAED